MDSPASSTDVEARWRVLTSAEHTVAEALLGDAWSVLRRRVTDLEDRLTDETVDRGLVIAVLCAMVLRVLRNPDGKRSETVEGEYAYSVDPAMAGGGLTVTADELELLATTGATDSAGAFTITPYGEEDPAPEAWVTSTSYVP